MDEREKLAKELRELYWGKDSGAICPDDLKLADWVISDRKRIVEPLKYTLEKFDSIHTKIQRQSYSFDMANDIRRALTLAGLDAGERL